MSENKMSDIIKASLDGIRAFTDTDTVVGNVITTPSGVTVIPVSRVSMGIATGGVDYGTGKSFGKENFGGGGGTGISITPIAFLTINRDAEINLIRLTNTTTDIDRIAGLIEHAPDLIERIKGALS